MFQSKRRERDVGAPVGNVGFTFEAGAFVELQFSESFRLRAEGRQGLGGHDGLLGDLSADFVVRNDNSYVFSIGPRARWADNDYHDAYYGVTPAVALAAGVPTFDAASGFYAIGAAAGLTVMLGERWGIEAQAGYDRLINDAADSPITRAFGSRNQYSAGLGLFYEFNVGDIF